MRELTNCECIGKTKFKSKAGKNVVISYYTYYLEREGSEGLACFQAFEDANVGETYQFIYANGQPVIVK